ncbi:hypothetical protein AYI70_g11223 [Smittium culicis]|uniref:Uncharacterized protein n=1 Tax=Smittium culicis TaxID=133412 RepID=A0A1R1X2U3_9FUNG|nr:hypothetical protein AYI70_g11223 [Smittium culicis]
MTLFINFASDDVGDGSAITSFHTSDGTPSAPGALLLGVSRSSSVISDHKVQISVRCSPAWAAVEPSIVYVVYHLACGALIVPRPGRIRSFCMLEPSSKPQR